MSNLPILYVRTKHSRYLIDQNTGTFSRFPIHEDASDLSELLPNGKRHTYGEIYGPVVGEPLFIETADGSWLRSTPVTHIEEVSVEVNA